MARLTLQLGLLSVTNLGIAFLFQWYVFVVLGPGTETDALFAAMTVPQLLLAVITGSLVHVLVPLLSREKGETLRQDAWTFLVIVGALFAVLAVALIVSAEWWVPLTVPGFSSTSQALTIELTRIQLVGMLFAGINGVQWATYHARQQFLWAELAPLLSGACSLLVLVWALPRFGITAAAWITTLRMALQTLLLAPGTGSPIRPDLRSPAVRQAWPRIKPLLLGTAYYKTDPLVDRFLLSMAEAGTVSLYYLAQQIYSAGNQVLHKAVAAPLVPLLSKLHGAGDKGCFRRTYLHRLWCVGAISLLAVGILVLLGDKFLVVFIGHGNVSPGNVVELWWILIWLAGFFVGGAAGHISSASFYAVGDTSTPTRLGMYTYTFYAPAKFLLFFWCGVSGLAISASAFLLLNFYLQNRQLHAKHM
jgi:putative peptidoglycan lipid II flippase